MAPRRALPPAAVAGCVAAAAAAAVAPTPAPAPWEPDFGTNYSLRVTTASVGAQRYFDAGLLHMYGFNKEEARKAFAAGVALDAGCAMCHWGAAFACGPTANDGGNACAATGYDEARAARNLSDAAAAAGRPLPALESGLIDAMAVRYSADGSGEEAGFRRYAAALDALRGRLSPRSDDVDVFYADQLMCIVALRYYENETMGHSGALRPEAADALAALERVLARSAHPFALHLYIHIKEPIAATDPNATGAMTDRLFRSAVRGSGHLLHMPGHMYNRIGRYADAVAANVRAHEADAEYQQKGAQPYIAGHNTQFLVWSAEMDGQSAVALRYARMPGFWSDWAALGTLVRYGDFAAVLGNSSDDGCSVPCRYARGLALAGTGDAPGAAAELAKLQQALPTTSQCREYWGVVNCLANKTLAARVALLHGDGDAAVALLRQGVDEENSVPYDEPPSWHYPTRQCLGAALLSVGRAEEAEAAYRADLRQWLHNAWSLRGLADAMRAQPEKYSAADVAKVMTESQERWARGDRPLTSSCMAFAL